MFKYIIAFSLFLLSFLTISGQEKVYPLLGNPVLKKQKHREEGVKRLQAPVYMHLPFLDDFTSTEVFPNQEKWADKYVFVNHTGAINPISFGVATFDAVDQYGSLYPHASTSPFLADKLTSHYLRLDSTAGPVPVAITPADSLYFSFYYQAQGYGNAPEAGDSLVLEFMWKNPDSLFIPADTTFLFTDTLFTPTDTILLFDTLIKPPDTLLIEHWRRVWSSAGMTYQNFVTYHGSDFAPVSIPIVDEAYFRKQFRFRFLNYASVAPSVHNGWAANVDQWHIDYVYVNMGRSSGNMHAEDVLFRKAPKTLLKNYCSMPWRHYLANSAAETVSSISLPYYNNSQITKNIKREFSITEQISGLNPYFFAGGNLNIEPGEEITFSPPVQAFAPNANDSAIFLVQAIINTSPDIARHNDTAWYYQRFYNFYAYDDGSPELGYGIHTKNAMFACEYNTRLPDTLRAIDIYFNETINYTGAQMYFKLMVWKSLEPEQIIYEKSGMRPLHEDSLNMFYRYRIDDETVLINGTFYIGWYQYSADFLNIGFDVNHDNSSKNFYKLPGNAWTASMYPGSVMLRPVFGKNIPYQADLQEHNKTSNAISIYPNPVGSVFYIDSRNLQNSSYELTIIDISGRLMPFERNENQVEVSGLNKGYYFARFTLPDGSFQTLPFVKTTDKQ